jgi:hypothetical protein
MSHHTTHAAAGKAAAATAAASVDLTQVKPYGDTMNDGMMQLSFTLPVPYGEEANEAAKILAKKMGLDEPAVVFPKIWQASPGLCCTENAVTPSTLPRSSYKGRCGCYGSSGMRKIYQGKY